MELKTLSFENLLFEHCGLTNDEQATRVKYSRRLAKWLRRVFDFALFFGAPSAVTILALLTVTTDVSCITVGVLLACLFAIGYLLGSLAT